MTYRQGTILSIVVVVTYTIMLLLIYRIVQEPNLNPTAAEAIRGMCESSYFEGQVDYIHGDIRVQKRGSEFIWIKSPWDNDTHFTGKYARGVSEVISRLE